MDLVQVMEQLGTLFPYLFICLVLLYIFHPVFLGVFEVIPAYILMACNPFVFVSRRLLAVLPWLVPYLPNGIVQLHTPAGKFWKDQLVLITGGARGLGNQLALRLLRYQATVIADLTLGDRLGHQAQSVRSAGY